MLRRLLALLAAAALAAAPAHAQSVLRDAETEALFRDCARPLMVAAGLDPKSVRIVLVGDEEVNAAAVGNQDIIVNAGTVLNADSVNELQGVLAHELGHVAGGHIVRYNEGTGPATKISILSLLLGVAAMAAGAGDLGSAILAGGQQAALGKYLAFSREVESRADQAAADYLDRAGITGRGMISFFEKLQGQEYRLAISQKPEAGYSRTHPLTGDRITALNQRLRASASWGKPIDAALQARFLRVKGKLAGYMLEPPRVLTLYPETDHSDAALYARAYAWHRGAYPEQANKEVDALVARDPLNPYFLELKGQILLESGKPADAIAPLRLAVARSRNEPLIATTLGHALVSTEDKANFAEAEPLLRTIVARDKENPFAWYQLGVIYDRRGDEPRASLATAERFELEGKQREAVGTARIAMAGLPKGTPDWLRAQDIALSAKAEMDRKKRR